MATTTNYISDLSSIRQFFHSLSKGHHSRATGKYKGIKQSQHDDIMRRLKFFDILHNVKSIKLGRANIHYSNKSDFINGRNYLHAFYELYTAVPEQLLLILYIFSLLSERTPLTLTNLYHAITTNDTWYDAYIKLLQDLHPDLPKNRDTLDRQYVSRIVKSLVQLGVLYEHNEGNHYTYALAPAIIDDLSQSQLQELVLAIFFYKNIAVTSAAGHILLKKIDTLLQNKNDSKCSHHYFWFRHNNPHTVLDNDILYTIAEALRTDKQVILISFIPGREPELVTPLRVQSYYGDNKNTLLCLHNGSLKTVRLDRQKSVLLSKLDAEPLPFHLLQALERQERLIIRFMKLTNYEDAYDTFRAHYGNYIASAKENTSHITLTLNVPDGLEFLPILRLFLPYVQLIHADKKNIMHRFWQNLTSAIADEFVEPSIYLQKNSSNPFVATPANTKEPTLTTHNTTPRKTTPTTTKKTPSFKKTKYSRIPKSITPANYISPVLHSLNAITFSTAYNLQYAILHGATYTIHNIADILNLRPLLAPNPDYFANDDYEYTLLESLIANYDEMAHAKAESNPIYAISTLHSLPPIFLTHAERMFLKDVITDSRVNWLLSDALRHHLEILLQDVPTTFPIGTCVNMNPESTVERPSIATLHTCLAALKQSCYVEMNGALLAPYRLEYSVSNNRFTLIALPEQSDQFERYPLETMHTITLSAKRCPYAMEELYATFSNAHKQTVSFTLYHTNNAIDRCFNYFNDYRIIAKETSQNTFDVTIRYMPFEETRIIQNLLKLGMAVKITDPPHIKEYLHHLYTTASQHM